MQRHRLGQQPHSAFARGYGWSRDDLTVVNDPFFFGKYPGFGAPGFDAKGFLGGLHAGANWQDRSIVGGLEIDLSLTDIRGSSLAASAPFVNGPTISNGTAANSGRFSLLGSARARLGYLVWPDVLIYGTGGLAWTRYTHTTDLNDSRVFLPPFAGLTDGHFATTSTPSWRFGWVAGIGGEARLFDSNWLARLEYLHYDFGDSGSSSAFDPIGGLVASRTSGDLTVDVVRAGLSYKLDRDPFAPDAARSAGPIVRASITKAPVRVAVPWTWSGFYIGAHLGYGWGRGNEPFDGLLLPTGVPVSGVDSNGFVAGFQAGANWQSGSVVGGLEIDLAGAGIKGSGSTATVAAPAFVTTLAAQTDKLDRLGSARARLGYLVYPGMLLYGTGGLGWTRFVNSQDSVTATSVVTPHWLFGWVAGVGLEARVGQTNWLARVEYLHYDFGDSGSFTQTNGGAVVANTTSSRITNDVVRTALSYKLDWPEFAGGRTVMPVKAPPQVWSWSGFYIGAHAGYGWGRDPFDELQTPAQFVFPPNPAPVLLSGPRSQGFLGGFQAGANWQDRSIVGGLEIDLSKSGIKGSASTAGTAVGGDPVAATYTDKLDLLGSARARLGYLAWPSVLIYGTGGLAWTRLEQDVTRTIGGATTITATPSWKFGWVAGVGGQARLWNSNWLARLEYLHYDFGDSGNTNVGFVANGAVSDLDSFKSSSRVTADVVRVGLDYKLD